MRQFDIYRNPSPRTRGIVPFIIALQSHHLEASHVCVVAPLVLQDGRSGFTLTSVPVRIEGQDHVVLVGELTSIDTSLLGRAVGNLTEYEHDLRRALERIFSGF